MADSSAFQGARGGRSLAGEAVALRRGGGEKSAQIVALARDRIGLFDDLRFLESVSVAFRDHAFQLLLQFADIDGLSGRGMDRGGLVIVRQGNLLMLGPTAGGRDIS